MAEAITFALAVYVTLGDGTPLGVVTGAGK
jgi:hypothetical protein